MQSFFDLDFGENSQFAEFVALCNIYPFCAENWGPHARTWWACVFTIVFRNKNLLPVMICG